MALVIPPGYVTRPTAARLYNRSLKSLIRDFYDAKTKGDQEVLSAFLLATNDGRHRDATQVTPELVAELKAKDKDGGQNPTWCVLESWLEDRYGKRGSPRPAKERETVATETRKTPVDVPAVEQIQTDSTPLSEVPVSDANYLPDDIRYLKQRIRTLEREKKEEAERLKQEIERNEHREEELFDQLRVKDGQIASWDGVAQAINEKLLEGLPSRLPKKGGSSYKEEAPIHSDVTQAQIIDSSSQPTSTDPANKSAKQQADATARKTSKKTSQPKKKKADKKVPPKKTKPAKQPKKESHWERLKRVANLRIG